MPSELLIKGGHVVTKDHALGDQPDSDELVRDGVIVEVRGRVTQYSSFTTLGGDTRWI
jgi:hypothetical protein